MCVWKVEVACQHDVPMGAMQRQLIHRDTRPTDDDAASVSNCCRLMQCATKSIETISSEAHTATDDVVFASGSMHQGLPQTVTRLK